MGRPREHGEAERAALLQAAAGVLGSDGPAAVTIRRVAQEAGVSTRAVYSLFGDKDGLLRELFAVAAQTMTRHHEAVPAGRDPVTEILPLALAYRAGALEHPSLYEFLIGGLPSAGRPAPTAQDLALSWRSYERVLDTVRRCVACGRFPGRDPRGVTMQLWALVHGLASLELRGFLGGHDDALALWRDAVSDAVTGFQQPVGQPRAHARLPDTDASPGSEPGLGGPRGTRSPGTGALAPPPRYQLPADRGVGPSAPVPAARRAWRWPLGPGKYRVDGTRATEPPAVTCPRATDRACRWPSRPGMTPGRWPSCPETGCGAGAAR